MVAQSPEPVAQDHDKNARSFTICVEGVESVESVWSPKHGIFSNYPAKSRGISSDT